VRKNWHIYCVAAVLASPCASAQKKVSCPDGDHFVTDVGQVAIKYEGQSLKGTLSSLSVFGASVSAEPKKLQVASEATQLWNEFIKALVVGYNSCAISKADYSEALRQLYPQLKQEASSLDVIRKLVADGQRTDRVRTKKLLDSYFDNLRRFVVITGKQIELERITALVDKTEGATEDIAKRLDELKARVDRLEKPTQVQSEIRKSLTARADEAESAYVHGYESFDRFRFSEAAESFRRALRIIKLPEFYLALGLACRELPALGEAEKALSDGLAETLASSDKRHEADFNAALGTVLFSKGDLETAIAYTQRAVSIDTQVAGPDNLDLARDLSNLGQLMRMRGDMQGALRSTFESLKIVQRALDPYDPRLATASNNWAEVLNDRLERGDAEEALRYTQQALAIAEKAYGSDSPTVALYTGNVAKLLQNKALKERSDFSPALLYAQRALEIGEKIYGPDHPRTAMFAASVGVILHNMGNNEGALIQFERALAIDKRVFSADNPAIGRDLQGIASCLFSKRDFDRAASYALQASTIHEKSYGAANVDLANDLNLLGTIFAGKGNLEAALTYKMRALQIDENIHGAENIEVAHDAFDIGLFLRAQGKLDPARAYFERALAIETRVYGPDDKFTIRIRKILSQIQQQAQQPENVQK
jgi:tetratricopeptide (TPR) repeat protein